MAYLNVNIPVTYAQIRREYLYDLKEHHEEAEDCIIFALASITGRPILFHAIMENGAIFYRLPISAFIQKGYDVEEVPRMRLDELELWNCFSYYPSITSFDVLDGQSGKFIGKDKKWYAGAYLFTVDWAHPESNIVEEFITIFCFPFTTIFNIPLTSLNFPIKRYFISHGERWNTPY